jgi:hypothetical protein
VRIKQIERSGSCPPLFSQNCLLGNDGSVSAPIAYLQRPKWVKDDDCWKTICESITISLPHGFEIK